MKQICCISVTERDQLFMHLQDHKYQPRFDCCICRLCFQTSMDLHDHYMANEDFCGKFYDKEGEFFKDFLIPKNINLCFICPKPLKNLIPLRAHHIWENPKVLIWR